MAYAGFWIRLAAYLIDSIILVLGIGFVTLIVALLFLLVSTEAAWIAGLITYVITALFGQWLYFAIMESSARQATWGKQLFKLKVTNLQGGRIGFGRATARFWALFISLQIFMPLAIIIGLTERKQGLHDMIAETYVVKNERNLPAAPTSLTTVRKKAPAKKKRSR